jgi:dCMP deaminase
MTGRERLDWASYALGLAFHASQRSEDPYCQVGAVALRADNSVAGVGYNGAPSGTEIDWSDRNLRRQHVIHAEANALRWTTPGEMAGGWLATTHHPCCNCLTLIASYGVRKVIYSEMPDSKNYCPEDLASTAAKLRIKMVPR